MPNRSTSDTSILTSADDASKADSVTVSDPTLPNPALMTNTNSQLAIAEAPIGAVNSSSRYMVIPGLSLEDRVLRCETILEWYFDTYSGQDKIKAEYAFNEKMKARDAELKSSSTGAS